MDEMFIICEYFFNILTEETIVIGYFLGFIALFFTLILILKFAYDLYTNYHHKNEKNSNNVHLQYLTISGHFKYIKFYFFDKYLLLCVLIFIGIIDYK